MAEAILTEETPSRPLKETLDGLENIATGQGTSKDKAQNNVWKHSGRNYDHVTLSARYREDWLAQKVVKIIPQDMTREWRKFESEAGEEADDHFGVAGLFREAYQWARLYGTSFIVMDIKDGRTPDKPINWKKLGVGCIKSFHVVDRTRIVATGDIEQNPTDSQYGMPTNYQFVGMTTTIHKDRLIRFEGTELPIYERLRNLWYSDSTLIPLMDMFDSFHNTVAAATQMVQEANIDVVTVDGLSEVLQNTKATNALHKRFVDWKNIKSVFGVTLLDSSETYEQKKMQLSGIKDLLWNYLEIVSASVGIPATRFLNTSPSGMNATGESDNINYVESLVGLQRSVFKPRLRVIDSLITKHFGLSDTDMKYEFNCAFPESISEREDRHKVVTDSMVGLVDSGILSPESALSELKKHNVVQLDATVGKIEVKNDSSNA